jgi:hypothetical protein
VTDSAARIIILCIVATFAAIGGVWKRPVTSTGKLSLWLCLGNVVSWLIILPMSRSGHPPQWLIIGPFLWILNLPLLIVTATLVWLTFRSHEEKPAYLVVASTYVLLNSLALYIVPLIVLLVWSWVATS